ncbi:MAG: serine/threonine protein kinase [Betaproteobacteria bacterium]|nr:MAG: serine/threonine protein kinase [Betaproteobacteria bacterium]
MDESTPYSELTPDCVLNAIESVGYRCDGRMLALNSYENRVFQIGIDDDNGGPKFVVAKFYRPHRWSDAQILEEHAFAFELDEAEIPVVAPLRIGEQSLHQFEGYRFALFPRRGGRAPELDDPDVLEWLGRFIGRIHARGAVKSFTHRPAIDIDSFGEQPVHYLLHHNFIPPDLVEAYRAAAQAALTAVRDAYQRAGAVETIRLHGDCHSGNILWTDDGPHFVDLDDARMGPAVQDLWMQLSGDRASMTRQLSDVLAGYEDFMEFDPRQLHLIEALRTLRILHYAGWIAQRWTDPAFPAAFTWFNTQRYWEEHILQIKEQISAVQEAPIGPL